MSSQTSASSVLGRNTIVDTDVHLSLDAEDIASYADEPYKSRLADDYCYPATIGSDWQMVLPGTERRSLSTPEQVQDVLVDGFDIDYPILNAPTLYNRFPDPELGVATMRAVNQLLLDQFLDDHDFLAVASLSAHKPDKAAEEIDDMAREDQIVGALIMNTGVSPPLGDPKYDIMWRAAEDNDMTIALHGAAGGGFPTEFPRQNQGLRTFLSVHFLAHPWTQMLTLTSMIVQGVPAKFPDLNFVVLESGLSWVPYMMFRLNKDVAIRKREASLLEKKPEEYLRESFYFGSQPLGEPMDAAHMQQIIKIIGAESVVFGTDYPHWDFDHPSALTRHLRTNFSEVEREQILSKTPAKAFGLDI